MWTPVAASDNSPVPCARNKHATALHGPHLYLFGGRNGNVPLRDLWRYHIANNEWTQLRGSGDPPGSLQEHSMVAYKNVLWVFGGELGFSCGSETPLWTYDVSTNVWTKVKAKKRGLPAPKGRRSHTATLFKDSMYIYGGYMDLKGSLSELWAYHFDSGLWRLVYQGEPSEIPPPRHRHSAIYHEESLWIFGGMTDLEERSDFWKWDFASESWSSIRSRPGPGRLHSHTAVKFLSVMLLFGGEKEGITLNELWRFHFATEFWEKLCFNDSKVMPQPRAQSTAFIFSHFQSSRGTVAYLSLPESSCSGPGGELTRRGNTRKSQQTYDFLPVESLLEEEEAEDNSKEFESGHIRELWRDLTGGGASFMRLDDDDDDEDWSENGKEMSREFLKDLSKRAAGQLPRMSRQPSYSMFTNESSGGLSPPVLSPGMRDSVEVMKFDLAKRISNGIGAQKKSDSLFTFQSYDLSSSSGCSTLSSAGSGGHKFNQPSNKPPGEESSSSSSTTTCLDLPLRGSFANPNYQGPFQGKEILSKRDIFPSSPSEEDLNREEFELSSRGHTNNNNNNVLLSSSSRPPHPLPSEHQDNQLSLLMYILGGREIGHINAFSRPLSVWKLDLTKTF